MVIHHQEQDLGLVMQVKGFPTLMFVDSKGEIKPYEGERTKDGLVEFIEANSVGASSSAASKEELQSGSHRELHPLGCLGDAVS